MTSAAWNTYEEWNGGQSIHPSEVSQNVLVRYGCSKRAQKKGKNGSESSKREAHLNTYYTKKENTRHLTLID